MSEFDELVVGDYDLEEDVLVVPASEALDYPDTPVQETAALDGLARPGNAPNTPREAIEKARLWHKERINVGVGMCLATVRQYYGVASGVSTAAQSYAMSAHKHHVTNGFDVPRGTPVYWTGGSSGAGHIALSVGGGLCLSTDWKEPGRIDYARINEITSHWGLNFVGFTQEVNGVLVWRPAINLGTVHLSKLKPGERNTEVLRLKKRLASKGYTGFIKSSNKFGVGTKRAYAKYQRRLGYSGSDANGVPGRTSLTKLGFSVAS